jgi:serine O-acetyltransferase
MNGVISNLLKAALLECCSPEFAEKVICHPLFELAVCQVKDDLSAFVVKDPAARGCPEVIVRGYSSFKAVAHYRLSRALLGMSGSLDIACAELQANVLLISCRGKMMSGAEIHPECQIGRRFVLDHGWGTVIGETVVLGDDCYILGGVTLGATGIAGNPSGKRHPTIGSRVEVGAFARIFGNVNIGDDVFIGPHCTIKHDIDAGSVVTLKSELQVTRVLQSGENSTPSFFPAP